MDVVKATLDDLDSAVDLAYSLQGDKKTRCRPLLVDASKHDIHKRFERYIKSDEHDILLVIRDGKLEGLTPINFLKEDLYVTYTQGPYGYDYEMVSNCLHDYLVDNFKGYTLYANTAKEHIESNRFFESKNFKREEAALMLKLENFSNNYMCPYVQEINKANSKTLYDWIDMNTDEDTYWNAKRISENLKRFIILGYFDHDLKGHIIGRGSLEYTEIIAFSGDDHVKEELLKSFLTKAHSKEVSLIDLYTEEAFEVSLGFKYGFELYDNNNCYIKHL